MSPKQPERSSSSLNYELLSVLAQYLEPKTLAIASCVSKNWFDSFSSDHLWKPLCSDHFPFILDFTRIDPKVSYSHLYAIAYSASKLRPQTPIKPRLAVEDLVFIITASTEDEASTLFTISKPCSEIEIDPNGLFKFNVKVNCECPLKKEEMQGLKITWIIVLKGWKGIFNMMESCKESSDGFFSMDLPLSGNCSGFIRSNIMAELKFGFCNAMEDQYDNITNEGNLNLGIMNKQEWRYLSKDDALTYLQEFLPCDS